MRHSALRQRHDGVASGPSPTQTWSGAHAGPFPQRHAFASRVCPGTACGSGGHTFAWTHRDPPLRLQNAYGRPASATRHATSNWHSLRSYEQKSGPTLHAGGSGGSGLSSQIGRRTAPAPSTGIEVASAGATGRTVSAHAVDDATKGTKHTSDRTTRRARRRTPLGRHLAPAVASPRLERDVSLHQSLMARGLRVPRIATPTAAAQPRRASGGRCARVAVLARRPSRIRLDDHGHEPRTSVGRALGRAGAASEVARDAHQRRATVDLAR